MAAGAGDDLVEITAETGSLRHAGTRIEGGEGHDTIRGAGSADTIDGGSGADELSGGGHDVFVLRRGEADGDLTLDFGAHGGGRDLLVLLGFGPGAALANAGGDTWTVGGESFRLAGVTALRADEYVLA